MCTCMKVHPRIYTCRNFRGAPAPAPPWFLCHCSTAILYTCQSDYPRYIYISMSCYVCNAFGPGGHPGGKHVFKMASYQLHGWRLCTSGARRIRDLDKSIAGPCNCIVYRDSRLLKAHSYSRSLSSNCVGDAAPKRSSGCGFVLTIIHHTSVRGLICAMRIPSNDYEVTCSIVVCQLCTMRIYSWL